MEVQEDSCSKAYRYPVYNGIHTAVRKLKRHLSSHMMIAGTRDLHRTRAKRPSVTSVMSRNTNTKTAPAASK